MILVRAATTEDYNIIPGIYDIAREFMIRSFLRFSDYNSSLLTPASGLRCSGRHGPIKAC